MKVTRSGALFQMGECADDDLSRFLKVLEPYPKQRELVEGIYDLCRQDPERCTDITALGEHLNIGRSTILQRTDRLMKLRLVRSSMQQTQPGVRPRTVYELNLPDGALLPALDSGWDTIGRSIDPSGEPEDPGQSRFDFDPATFPQVTQLHYHPELQRRLVWKGERFTVFSLLAGLRMGRTGKEVHHKETKIYMGPRSFHLEVQAIGKGQIASVLDLRVLIVVCTLLKDHVRNAEGPTDLDQGFTVNMTSLCAAMGMDPVPGNKRHLFQQLLRWQSSRFRITKKMHSALDWAPEFKTGDYFYCISRMAVLESLSQKDGATPELVALFLDKRIIDALPDVRRTLSIHREILLERKPKPFMHLSYYWCRRVVQHAHDPQIFTLEHLRRELRPNLTLHKFRAEFTEMMADQKVDLDGQLAKIPGYFIQHKRLTHRTKNKAVEEVAIYADPEDPIVGKDSRRQLAEEKRMLRALQN